MVVQLFSFAEIIIVPNSVSSFISISVAVGWADGLCGTKRVCERQPGGSWPRMRTIDLCGGASSASVFVSTNVTHEGLLPALATLDK